MKAEYPKWIPNPAKPGEDIFVKTEDAHKTQYPDDYALFLASIPVDPISLTEAVSKAVAYERKQCAEIARAFPGAGPMGQAIADAILNAEPVKVGPEDDPLAFLK